MASDASIWEILGVSSDADRKAIRRAYAAQVRKFHPEDDPEGFQRLRDAYEEALQWNDRDAGGILSEEFARNSPPKTDEVSSPMDDTNESKDADEAFSFFFGNEETAISLQSRAFLLERMQEVYETLPFRMDWASWQTCFYFRAFRVLRSQSEFQLDCLRFLDGHRNLSAHVWENLWDVLDLDCLAEHFEGSFDDLYAWARDCAAISLEYRVTFETLPFDLSPEVAEAYIERVLRMEMAMEKDDEHAVRRLFWEAVRLYPADLEAYRIAARYFLERDDFDETGVICREALLQDADNEGISEILREL